MLGTGSCPHTPVSVRARGRPLLLSPPCRDRTVRLTVPPAGYALLRDQVNQLRMENDELKANIAKMRYGTSSQVGGRRCVAGSSSL